jgi:hypothetical protein
MSFTNQRPEASPKTDWWRYAVTILTSLIIMLCAGSIYAWSVFVEPLQQVFGFSVPHTVLE